MARYMTDDELGAVAEEIAAADPEHVEEGTTPEEPEPPEEGDEGTSEEGDVGEEPAASEQEPDDQESDAPTDEARFIVKMAGQEVEVTESELVRGYLRQDDYTRKTQLLASQRRQLEEANQLIIALERNPESTLKVLARHYKVDDYQPDDEGPSPEQVRLMELEQWRQVEQARQREATVNATLERLHRDYGEFDEDALFSFAVERNVSDLETALRAMTWNQLPASRRIEKRATAAVAGGGSRNGTARPKAPPERISSFHDAYQAAKRELDLGN